MNIDPPQTTIFQVVDGTRNGRIRPVVRATIPMAIPILLIVTIDGKDICLQDFWVLENSFIYYVGFISRIIEMSVSLD